MIASSKGGVNIEEVAATDPSAIIKAPIDINTGVTDKLADEVAEKMGFRDKCKNQAAQVIKNLYNLFIKSDGSLLEINPMVEDVEGDGEELFQAIRGFFPLISLHPLGFEPFSHGINMQILIM